MQNESTDRIKDKVADIKEAYEKGRDSVREMSQAAVDTSKEAVAFTDEWVRDNSWKLLGISLGFGLILGLLMGWRSDEPRLERVPR
jgi:ElaB/YqjD/DUF883 family membrane-anchored ribosome-binding protein